MTRSQADGARDTDIDQHGRSRAIHAKAPNWTDSSVQSTTDRGYNRIRNDFPHIRDLQAQAQLTVKEYGTHLPVRKLLDLAEDAAKRVVTDVTFKRQDRAYVEYIVCSEILLNIIPRHRDYIVINSDRGDWQRRYRSLCIKNNAQNDDFKQIFHLIVDDNDRSGIKPRLLISSQDRQSQYPGHSRPIDSPSARPLSMPDSPSIESPWSKEESFQGPTDRNSTPSYQIHHDVSQPSHQAPSRGRRPAVQPKPQNLRVHISQQAKLIRPVSREDDLADRFSNLRVQHDRPDTLPTGSSSTQNGDSNELSSSTDYTPPSSEDSSYHGRSGEQLSGPTVPPSRPSGPRSMPASSAAPTLPPKIPLTPLVNDSFPIMPQPPKPAYDPTKSAVSPSTARATTLNRKSSIIGRDDLSPVSTKRHSGHQILPNGMNSPIRSSSRPPRRASISANELYDKFHKSNVLVIDVRNRDIFDSGHILAKSIICVEPVGIQPGMSTEELRDRLISSPSSEQVLFDKVDEFDLVVYHDQYTQTDRFLRGPPTQTEADHLRTLHDTLTEFNDYKSLRKPPVVLLGGLESWVDLVGPQALATSKTAVQYQSNGIRRSTGRPTNQVGRAATASSNSSLEVRKRRLREQKALNPDEEQQWREKALKEEVNPADYEVNRSDLDTNDEEPPSPFMHSYEDFLRRFPEASTVQQSMKSVPPPPNRPPLPLDSLSGIPSLPARPLPAVARPSYSGVSDRQSSQFSPVSRQSSAHQQPLYTSRTLSQYRKLPRTGLVNFGVTCYMNATIQCLLATIPVSQLFLGDDWRHMTQQNWKGSNGLMPGIFANLIRSLWTDDGMAVRPSSMRKFCARLKDEWGVDRQQDAKEFFDFMVDCLHEDLNRHWDRTALEPLTEQQELVRESWPVTKAAKIEWQRYTHREESYISNVFAGQHASQLRCTTCNNTSTTYEAFYSISIEIPRQSPKRGMWDIYSCLRSYCHEEKLSGDEVWKCPHCKCEREATKKITITRAPSVLVVHFKRFEMRRGDAKKVHTPINFPLYGLDLKDFMVESDPSSQPSPNETKDPATDPPYIYEAYAVMRHIGNTGNGGHYISLVRDIVRNCWRKFDDDRVEDFDPAKLKGDRILQNDQAYLVFYGRTHPR